MEWAVHSADTKQQIWRTHSRDPTTIQLHESIAMSDTDPSGRAPREHRWLRLVDRLTIAIGIVAALFMAVRHGIMRIPKLYDPLPSGVGGLLAYLVIVLLMVLMVRIAERRGGLVGAGARLVTYAIAIVGGGMVWSRVKLFLEDSTIDNHWPPRIEVIKAMQVDSLSSQLRADYAMRIAAHRFSDDPTSISVPAIPAAWPYPSSVKVAVLADSQWVQLWTMSPDGTTACAVIRRHAAAIARDSARNQCPTRQSPPAAGEFASPQRLPDGTDDSVGAYLGEPWPEYRRDTRKSGAYVGAGVMADSGWTTFVDGPIRASVSVVGPLVLVGAHGTGTLTALSLENGATRWQHRVPNWIHQDPVSDGRTVVVGFGDNEHTFSGRAPMGVAAFAVATGRRRWSAFDLGAVMTSSVVRDTFIVYGTEAGLLMKRSLHTGALLAQDTLPGKVTMAPPTSVGDTIVFTMDHNWVCAYAMSTLRQIWCRELPNLRLMGHAAGTVYNGAVLVSGIGTPLSMTLRDFVNTRPRTQIRLVKSLLFPTLWEEWTGQVFASLRLSDGTLLWKTPLFRNPRAIEGHISGTATVSDGIGVIVLPQSDTLLAFNPADGKVRWAAGAHAARGPVLIHAGRVFLAGRDGMVETRMLDDGELRCSVKMPDGFDRAGPVLAGQLLIFASLKGRIDAVPVDRMLDCPEGTTLEQLMYHPTTR